MQSWFALKRIGENGHRILELIWGIDKQFGIIRVKVLNCWTQFMK